MQSNKPTPTNTHNQKSDRQKQTTNNTKTGADPPDKKENQQKPQNTKGKRKSTQGRRGAAEEHKVQECRRSSN
jgi:hypothetical protein